MEKRLSALYIKHCDFERRFFNFKKFDDQYNLGTLPKKEYLKFFHAIKECFIFYVRILKQDYRLKGISLSYPTEVLKRAGKDAIIDDAKLWLRYIEFLNEYYQNRTKNSTYGIVSATVKTYHDKVYSMLKYLHNDANKAMIKKMKELEILLESQDYEFDNSTPIYSATELGITPRSYDILIDYFKSRPMLKNVYFHGSRLYGTCTQGSDIDLILDCPQEDYKHIIDGLEKLNIPYYLDCKCTGVPLHNDFVKKARMQGTKIMYRAKDLQIYWNNSMSKYNKNEIKIGNLIQ